MKNLINRKEMISVKNTKFYDYFEDKNSLEKIYLLSKTEANKFWSKNIDSRKKHFFHLEDENWLVKSEKIILGDWLDSYNSGKFKNVSKLLNKKIKWLGKLKIYFIANSDNIFFTDWVTFLLNWDDFIAIEDDASIILNETLNREGLMFYSKGDIVYFK